METKTQERKPLFVKQVHYRNLIGVHNIALKRVQPIANEFLKLDIGVITSKDLEQIAALDFKEIRKRFDSIAGKDLQGFKSDVVRKNMMTGVESVFTQFQDFADKAIFSFRESAFYLGQHYPELSVKNFTVKNGEILFTEANKENIMKEFCTVYLSGEAQEKFVELAKQTHELLQALKTILVKNNIGNLFSEPGYPGVFYEENEEIGISLEFVEYVND